MKLGTIRVDGHETVIGRVDDENGVALAPATMEDLIAGGDAALADAQKAIDNATDGSPRTLTLLRTVSSARKDKRDKSTSAATRSASMRTMEPALVSSGTDHARNAKMPTALIMTAPTIRYMSTMPEYFQAPR